MEKLYKGYNKQSVQSEACKQSRQHYLLLLLLLSFIIIIIYYYQN